MSRRLNFPCKALLFCCFVAPVVPVQAQSPNPEVPKRVECNCAELSFTLQPGGSQNFVLPAVQGPVRVEVSFTADNGGTQEPSELMYALVNQDPSSKQLTWIGTSNNGSTSGSSSLKGTLIASIFGGGPPTTNASLEVVNPATRTLAIKQNAATTAIPGHYIVRFCF
ncbi:MAG TPA: hypothetical protein VMB02_00690 [Candidatus Aquilonibacter sp.]|nr:hypothetical protein [Candidatus Aquilonibacter sp.]